MAPRKAELDIDEKKIRSQLFEKPQKPAEIETGMAKQPAAPSRISQFYFPVETSIRETESLVYRPALLGSARLHFVSARAKLDVWQERSLYAPIPEEDMPAPWDESTPVQSESLYLEKQPRPDAGFSALPAAATRAASFTRWKNEMVNHLYQYQALTLWECREFK
jgi:hypothetical protein